MPRYGDKTPRFSDKIRRSVIPALLLAIAAILAAQSHRQLPRAQSQKDFLRKFIAAAVERTHHAVRYDPKYFWVGERPKIPPRRRAFITEDALILVGRTLSEQPNIMCTAYR